MAKIYQRGKIWWGRITYKGKEYRESLETTSERVAKERFLTFVSDIKNGKWGDKRRHTFDEAVNKFIEEHFPRIRESSARRYLVSLMNLANMMEGKFLDEISSAILSDFETARRKEGVTNSTIRRDLVCLQVLFSCAEDWEWVEKNPAKLYLKKAKRRGLVEANPRNRFLSNFEEEKLFEELRTLRLNTTRPRDLHAYQMHEAAFAFAIDSGLRDGELLSLQWNAVDLEKQQVRVEENIAKGGKAREVPILKRSLMLLRSLPRSEHSDYVFWHRDGQRYYGLYLALQRLCKRAGIERVSFHDLRRTCGQRRLRNDRMSMESVQKWLGHTDLRVTQRVYAFLSVEDLHKAVKQSHNSGT